MIIALIITSEILYLSVLYSKKFNPTNAESLIIVIVPFFFIAYVLFISKKNVLNLLFILLVLYKVSIYTYGTNTFDLAYFKTILNYFTSSLLFLIVTINFRTKILVLCKFILKLLPVSLFLSWFFFQEKNPDILHFVVSPVFFLSPFYVVMRKKTLYLFCLILIPFIFSIDYRTNILWSLCFLYIFIIERSNIGKSFTKNFLMILVVFIISMLLILDYNIWLSFLKNILLNFSDIEFDSNFEYTGGYLFSDTRSNILVSVLEFIKNSSFDQLLFGTDINAKLLVGSIERTNTESAFVNLIFKYGLFGFFTFYGVLIRSIYNGFFKSNNKFSFYISVILSFSILFSLIQNIFFWFSLSTVIFYLLVNFNLNSKFYKKSQKDMSLILLKLFH